MSKTDKTAPYWVRFHYEPHFLKPEHDHRFHECNLPPRPGPKDAIEWHGGKDRPCFWWVDSSFWSSRWGKCPCYMCSRYAYDVPKSLRERREGKKYCRGGWQDEY